LGFLAELLELNRVAKIQTQTVGESCTHVSATGPRGAPVYFLKKADVSRVLYYSSTYSIEAFAMIDVPGQDSKRAQVGYRADNLQAAHTARLRHIRTAGPVLGMKVKEDAQNEGGGKCKTSARETGAQTVTPTKRRRAIYD
jgi:hypothetical protein